MSSWAIISDTLKWYFRNEFFLWIGCITVCSTNWRRKFLILLNARQKFFPRKISSNWSSRFVLAKINDMHHLQATNQKWNCLSIPTNHGIPKLKFFFRILRQFQNPLSRQNLTFASKLLFQDELFWRTLCQYFISRWNLILTTRNQEFNIPRINLNTNFCWSRSSNFQYSINVSVIMLYSGTIS